MNRLRVIKEPIHDYIPVSQLESRLINDPLFLRLQHISQNGLAYLTYPNNRTSRFLHSLGTMHLGGDMILSALVSSEVGLQKKFTAAFKRSLSGAERDLSLRFDQIREILQHEDDIFYRHKGLNPKTADGCLTILLIQSVRIACVLHDIGHPPFSHTLEGVLQAKLDSLPIEKLTREERAFEQLNHLGQGELGQLHEHIGRALTLHVFSSFSGRLKDYARFCFWVANRIVEPEIEDGGIEGVWDCLHSIVSGEIDADRCDYVLRDGYASSFEFGTYDLSRIMHNLRLSKVQGNFCVTFTTAAVSALESFFLERFRVWRWIVFHPNVLRSEIALSRLLAAFLDITMAETPSRGPQKTIKGLLEELEFPLLWKSFKDEAAYRKYVQCDEPWLLTILRRVQKSKIFLKAQPRRMALIKIYLDFVLDREKLSFKAMWKRPEDYEQFCKEAALWVPSTFASGSSFAGNDMKGPLINSYVREKLTDSLDNEGEISCMRRLEGTIQKGLLKEDFQGALLTKVCKFNIFNQGKVFVADASDHLMPLEQLSTVVDNLSETWARDIQFRAFWIGLRKVGRSSFSVETRKNKSPSTKLLARETMRALSAWDG